MERELAWKKYKNKQIKEMESLCKGYREFLDNGKTERECVTETVEIIEKAGYKNLDDIIAGKKKVKTGDKVYAVCMNKSIAMFNIGKKSMEDGINILGAHIDSPRIDIKQNPLYEDSDFAYLDTHYYGGIKKYQWVALPLAIHGVVAKKDGTVVNVVIGEDKDDPVVSITDLLIHLSADQMTKTASKVIEGEQLDILIGSKPLAGEEKDAVKKNILKLIKEKYDIEEDDFLSAELEVVPAGPARDTGLDASMILAYGQDDRVCAYTSLIAMLEVEAPEKTSCCLLVDKEEIGSVGATGMASHMFENAVAEVIARLPEGYSELSLRRSLANSIMLSSDVNAAYDPKNSSLYDKDNSSSLGGGLVLNKYTGSRGKSGASDANPEFIARLRGVFDKAGVSYQMAELGKVDQGGGGTIAYLAAKYGMNVLDAGVAVLSMHAPWEIIAKEDLIQAYAGYKAFLKI